MTRRLLGAILLTVYGILSYWYFSDHLHALEVLGQHGMSTFVFFVLIIGGLAVFYWVTRRPSKLSAAAGALVMALALIFGPPLFSGRAWESALQLLLALLIWLFLVWLTVSSDALALANPWAARRSTTTS